MVKVIIVNTDIYIYIVSSFLVNQLRTEKEAKDKTFHEIKSLTAAERVAKLIQNLSGQRSIVQTHLRNLKMAVDSLCQLEEMKCHQQKRI